MPAADTNFSIELVKNYFSQLNPIAHRIANDIDETKSNYGQLWCKLNPNEQNDIINETLIRPELSLRYFENFATSAASSSSSSSSACISPNLKCASADSLAAVVLKNINDSLGRPTKSDAQKLKSTEKNHGKDTKRAIANIKQFYAYDGRNLRTFSVQKVALKIVHDDALGAYRDEHSMPFNFRTKSQINLHLFTDGIIENVAKARAFKKDEEICLLNASFRATEAKNVPDKPKPDKISMENYKKLQNELKLNLRRDSKEKSNVKLDSKVGPTTTTYERLENQKFATANMMLPTKVIKTQACRPQVKPPPAPIAASNNNDKKSIIVDCKSLEMSAINRNQNEQRLKALLNSNSSSSTYAIYTDTYYDHGEHTNLMNNFGSSGGIGSGLLTASSSSAATSDDDDEKTLCEEVKLLDNESCLRKGFDFLNNW